MVSLAWLSKIFPPTDIARIERYAPTFATEAVILVCSLITLRLAATTFGSIGFGEYSVARRAMSIVAFPLLLGLGIGIPRYVALSQVRSDPQDPNHVSYFIAGVAISLPLVTLFCLAVLSNRNLFINIFFGSDGLEELALPTAVATVGMYTHTLVYSYFRGRLAMRVANLFHLVSLGGIPPCSIWLGGTSTSLSIMLMGCGWLATSAFFCIRIFTDSKHDVLSPRQLMKAAHDLLVYGLPRVPGELGLFGLFAIPTFIVARRQGVEAAGYFSYGVSLLQLFAALFSTIGILLLPSVSRLKAATHWRTIEDLVSKVLLGSLTLSTVLAATLAVILPQVTYTLMGPSFPVAVEQSRWMVVAAVPYVAYLVLRNPIDAVAVWPYNSVNVSITLIFTVICLIGLSSYMSPQICMFAALMLLGILSGVAWSQSLSKKSLR